MGSVAPLVGAWIEIFAPSVLIVEDKVAPLVGAWIEINLTDTARFCQEVAPLVGAWIEMAKISLVARGERSLPLWERGLKYLQDTGMSE